MKKMNWSIFDIIRIREIYLFNFYCVIVVYRMVEGEEFFFVTMQMNRKDHAGEKREFLSNTENKESEWILINRE